MMKGQGSTTNIIKCIQSKKKRQEKKTGKRQKIKFDFHSHKMPPHTSTKDHTKKRCWIWCTARVKARGSPYQALPIRGTNLLQELLSPFFPSIPKGNQQAQCTRILSPGKVIAWNNNSIVQFCFPTLRYLTHQEFSRPWQGQTMGPCSTRGSIISNPPYPNSSLSTLEGEVPGLYFNLSEREFPRQELMFPVYLTQLNGNGKQPLLGQAFLDLTSMQRGNDGT